MTQEYWDKKHSGILDSKITSEPSAFARYAVDFFPKTGKILDIGTGKGGDANFFKSLGYEVIATDFSSEALKIAEENFKNIKFINLDTSKGLPFNDKHFDIVYSQMALHYFDEKTTNYIFKDIYRVLKVGGIFATITNTTDDTSKGTDDYVKIEPDFYRNTLRGITKRYFSIESMSKFIKDLFEIIILDNKGKLYYKNNLSLIRFIGKKK